MSTYFRHTQVNSEILVHLDIFEHYMVSSEGLPALLVSDILSVWRAMNSGFMLTSLFSNALKMNRTACFHY